MAFIFSFVLIQQLYPSSTVQYIFLTILSLNILSALVSSAVDNVSRQEFLAQEFNARYIFPLFSTGTQK
jgi:ABC-type polysaccharide/polyol phosphate export permease